MNRYPGAFLLALILSCQTAMAGPGERRVGFLADAALSLDGSNLEDFVESPPTGINADYDGATLGGELGVGLVLGPYAQLRLGHRQFGDQEADLFSGSTLVGKVDVDASGNFFAADLMVPVMEEVSLGVTLGSIEWHGELTSQTISANSRSRESGSDLFAGIRGLIRLNETFHVSTFATRYDLETEDGDDLEYGVLGAGIQARF